MAKKHGILGHLINKLKSMHFIRNQEEFFDLLKEGQKNGSIYFNSAAISHAVQYDYYSSNTHQDLSTQLRNAQEFKIRLLKMNEMIEKNENTNEIDSFLRYMKPIIEKTHQYATRRLEKYSEGSSEYNDSFCQYDTYQKKILENYFAKSSPSVPLVHYIYLLIYWSVLKSLPATFSFETNYRNQLNEFNEQVLCKYGVGSAPGRRAVMQLAQTNIFAMYEVGNFYYYGNTENQRPDYNKALEYFRKAAGLSNDESIDSARCNPLALWLVSYMYINYQRRMELKDAKNIYEIERLSWEDRIKFSIRYCKYAIQQNGCIPAINMLGIISNLLDDNGRATYSLKTPDAYFLEAANSNYVYAYNNLATMEIKAVFNTTATEQKIHLEKCIEYLAKAANEHEPWASNTLGLLYCTGELNHENKKLIFTEIIDPEKALYYFETASNLYTNINSAWAYVNMMVYFPEKYIDNSHLLEQHLIYCCDLNNVSALKFLCKNIEKTCLNQTAHHCQNYFIKVLQRLNIEAEFQKNVTENLMRYTKKRM